MTDLRRAAERALDALENPWKAKPEGVADAIQALRQALAQPEWAGLTDEEIDVAVKSCNTLDTYKYFRAIEDKLKEKNT